jgi:choline kinase
MSKESQGSKLGKNNLRETSALDDEVKPKRAILIGAGRGERLAPLTDGSHKCFTEIRGKRIIDWILEALLEAGIEEICYIDGFNGHIIRDAFPNFIFRHNKDWARNNILSSLMHAEDLMDQPFISSYCDILYTGQLVRDLVASPADIALGTDTDWLNHYRLRTQHPPSDGEKLSVENGLVAKVSRTLASEETYGEFVGVAKFSRKGAEHLRRHFHRCRKLYAGKPFREGRIFEQAMMIHLLDEMIEQGVAMAHVDTHGKYREIDTHEDCALAETYWRHVK